VDSLLAGKRATRRRFLAVMSGVGVTVGIGALTRACGMIGGPHGIGTPGSGLTTFITPNEDFFLMSNIPSFKPELDLTSVESAWSLSLNGFGGRQHVLRYSDLRNLQAVDFLYTVECIANQVGGSFIGNAQWRGTPLKNVLEPVLPGERSGYVVMFRALDGYYSSVSIERCLTTRAFRLNAVSATTAFSPTK
jgi:DMSO/TMAO reductase YedYZ molybdopterin-dependent catalytic subunit